MTNEEAVKILRRIQDPEAWEPQITRAAFEALDMAIEALGRRQAAGSGELISKQDAITALTFAKETGTMKCGELKCVIEVLNRLPSAGPKRGKWINDRCSVCGYGVMPWNNTPYCPRCGADMRGDSDE